MKREQLEKHLNEKVKVQLFNGDIIEGYLRKQGKMILKTILICIFQRTVIF